MWHRHVPALLSWLALLPAAALLGLQQIRVSVDVALVNATVVDSRGNPVEGLRGADFEVTVAKRPSPVWAVDYISLGQGTSQATGEGAGRENLPASTERVSRRSRSVVFLLDDLSFRPQPARELGLALERLLPLLGDSDLVGLTTTSGLGPSVTPTVERAQILAALPRFAGRRELISAPFVIGVDEALGSDIRSASNSMVRRECEFLPLGGSCGSMVLAAARREASAAVRRTEDQVRAIAATIEWMKNLDQPRVMILVSDGIAADVRNDLAGQVRMLSEAATSASVQLYALTGVGDGADVSDITPDRRSARVSERRYLARGVQTMTTAAGGESFVVVGQPDRFLQRIALETSAFYQLAVQIEPPSATEPRFLDVRVKVKRPGVTVRVKPFALRASATSR